MGWSFVTPFYKFCDENLTEYQGAGCCDPNEFVVKDHEQKLHERNASNNHHRTQPMDKQSHGVHFDHVEIKSKLRSHHHGEGDDIIGTRGNSYAPVAQAKVDRHDNKGHMLYTQKKGDYYSKREAHHAKRSSRHQEKAGGHLARKSSMDARHAVLLEREKILDQKEYELEQQRILARGARGKHHYNDGSGDNHLTRGRSREPGRLLMDSKVSGAATCSAMVATGTGLVTGAVSAAKIRPPRRKVGHKVPMNPTFYMREHDPMIRPNPYKWKYVTAKELFMGKRTIVFSLPGAYTPTCSATHLPRYEQLWDKFRSAGVDQICCVSVNDGPAFTMNTWGQTMNARNVQLIPDGNYEFTQEMGYIVDKRNLGFGIRSWRYSMVVEKDGTISKIYEEAGFGDDHGDDPFDISDADTMLTHLSGVESINTGACGLKAFQG